MSVNEVDVTSQVTGYAHPLYTQSLTEFGKPISLNHSGGALLKRQITNSQYYDLMGPYPLFCCRDWSSLECDIKNLNKDLASLILVTDPFATVQKTHLERYFDVVDHYQDHYIADLSQPVEKIISRGHMNNVNRAIKLVKITVERNPSAFIEQWIELYNVLIKRHSITGLQAFSRRSFEQQLEVPGVIAFVSRIDDQIVGIDIWYVSNNCAYGHLVAFSDLGYQSRAAYASKWYLLKYFQEKGIKFVQLGGVPSGQDKKSGLAHFKSGWSNTKKPVFLCKKIINHALYHKLCEERGVMNEVFFPAYRSEEFI